MPEVSGEEILQILRKQKRYAGLPVLAMTANVFVEEQKKIFELGFDALILKPFVESEMIGKISEVIEKKIIMPRNTHLFEDNENSFDLSDIRYFCMNDEKLFLEIMEEWLKVTEKDNINLKIAIKESNFQLIEAITHQLGSRLAQIKSNASEIAYAIENQLKTGNTKNLGPQVDRLTNALNLLISVLSEKIEGMKTTFN
jgi:CheY-like chemotaxis protein